jgi:hypothetical protein
VSHYYWFWSSWTQCRVVNAELGRTDACQSPVPADCNVPWWLDRALTRTDNFVSITGPATFAQVKAEIDAGRPVGARVGWSGGGGHFMCIYGYSRFLGLEYLDIDDPIYGKSHLSVADFSSSYQGSGTWTHTYYTKRYFRLPILPLLVDEAVLRKIWDVRPLLKLKGAPHPEVARESATDTRAQLGLAQPVYTVGLDALTAGHKEAVTGSPSGVRVYETLDGVPQAYYDVDEGREASVRTMSASERHLEPFRSALEAVVARAEESEREAQLRLYRVPALNFEALWLSHEDGEGDVLVPLTALGPVPQGEPVPFAEAVGALREAARRVADQDDTQGA